MMPSFSGLLPAHFSPDSRVWIYQADRPFTDKEKQELDDMLQDFVHAWRSHGAVVSGFGTLLFDRFVVLIADETAATVSGCSTDSSVQLIREIQQKFNVGMFDRQQLAFIADGEIRLFPLSGLKSAVHAGTLSGDSPFFNNAVTTLAEMRKGWILPAAKSWLQHRPAFAVSAR